MFTVEQARHALQAKAGNVSQAAAELGVSRTALYNKINKNPSLAAALNDIREELVDMAESTLRTNVQRGDNSAVFYVLNNAPEAKRRGWGPRQELTGADGGPVQHSGFEVTFVDYRAGLAKTEE